ncbi:MAG: hypothetical protein AB7W59_18610 [Acidimicrobiia bacterium]
MRHTGSLASSLLEQEGRALLTRLDQVRPFVLHETMTLAAALPFHAQLEIERFLHAGREALRRQVHDYLRWIRGPGATQSPAEQQRRFVLIRLQFNAVLSQFDLFTEVVTQRSEHQTGVWLSGLDSLAEDSLRIKGMPYRPPPVVCYLARGPGAAIRRARTRLPGGAVNPVAIIRVPRERMIGHGIASSLVHEVGHQAAALLGVVDSLKPLLDRRARDAAPADRAAWASWSRWISEIVADFWSVGKLGVASTLGLFAVVSLPRFFVFRPSVDDPHPTPYVRVLVSASIGRSLYPHTQWDSVASTWKRLYPTAGLEPASLAEIAALERTMPAFVEVLASHRPAALNGRSLREVMPIGERTPAQLLGKFKAWRCDLGTMARQPPSLVFAAVGQARSASWISPEVESRLLTSLLQAWAVRSSLRPARRVTVTPPIAHNTLRSIA